MRIVLPTLISLALLSAAAWAQAPGLRPGLSPPPGLGPPAREPELDQPPQPPDVLTVETRWQTPQATPGQRLALAVIIDLQEGWHINPDAAQCSTTSKTEQVPTTLVATRADAALLFETPQFPVPKSVPLTFAAGEALPVYDGRVILYVPVKVAEGTPAGEYRFTLALRYQACDDRLCLFPTTRDIPVTLQVADGAEASASPDQTEIFAGFDRLGRRVVFEAFGWSFSIDAASTGGLVLLLLVAALGGLLLNFTPCVLPVVPLKIMSLSRAADNRRRCLALGVAMSLGVVAFWLGLGAMVAFVAGFESLNALFQHPEFTITVGIVIAAMAVGMCGLFAVRLPQWIYNIQPRHDTLAGSFGFGIMTAVLSTPCTAPLMGAAAAWAITQHPTTTLLVFAWIGAGMALPYLVLSAFPFLVNRLPRTGPGSELIKQVMGLLMLAAAAFFIGTGVVGFLHEPPGPPSRLYWWPVMACVAAAGVWLAYRTWRITAAPVRRGLAMFIAWVTLVAAVYGGVRFTSHGPIDWVHYTPQRLEEVLAEKRIVVMEFTAEWCLNCKALEEAVLRDPRIVEAMKQPGVVPMRVDLTGSNPVGDAKLRATGRNTIPWLVVLNPDGSVAWGSDAYTVQQVLDAIAMAGK
ncbi:MAG: cytochrome c biogenesis protein CcdA [Phycisphaeraceae bacterium]